MVAIIVDARGWSNLNVVGIAILRLELNCAIFAGKTSL